MKRLVLLVAIIVALTGSIFCAEKIKMISFEDLKKSLEGKPAISVGFDVDDTVLYSSPGFYYGKMKYSPKGYSFLGNKQFWFEMNNYLDIYSLPKDIAKKVIRFHKKRGDNIFFITARNETKTEVVTEILEKIFDIKKMNKVIFTGHKKGENLKVKPIKDNNIKIYYGDSDSDITAAQEAGIRGIRIMRAGNSSHKPMPKNGNLGEEVLENSEF
ncbi:acid phosphatase AphA [bacterium]|nr:acid phosphatase AphA [bacterium]